MLFAQLSTDGSLYPAMFEITGGIPEPIFDEPQEAESQTRIEISVRVFCSLRIQSSIFGDPLSWFFQRTIIPNEMKDLNCITITPGK